MSKKMLRGGRSAATDIMRVAVALLCCALAEGRGTRSMPAKTAGAETASLGMGVEHVFFRQKATVHTTRSRWIIGLVLDLQTYERVFAVY